MFIGLVARVFKGKEMLNQRLERRRIFKGRGHAEVAGGASGRFHTRLFNGIAACSSHI